MSYTDLTPYFAAKVASAVTGELVKSQTMYGYARTGKIKSNHDDYKAGKAEHVMLNGDAFAEWLAAPKTGRASTDITELVAEYSTATE